MLQRFSALIFLTLFSTQLSAQWFDLRTPGIPRNADGSANLSAPTPMAADGHKDLTGLWLPSQASGSLYDLDKLQPWARDAMIRNENNFFRDDPRFACLPSGPGVYPAGTGASGLRRIVQHPSFMAILYQEMTFRQVYLDGRELEASPFPTWEGYSVGHWEGDTLVVESNGFNNLTWLHRDGLPHTEQLRITERYRRLDFGHIEIQLTYNDPGTFTEPVEATIMMEFRPDNELLEVVCNENQRGLSSNWQFELEHAEANVAEVPTEILQTYVGTYEGVWLGTRTTAEFVIEDGEFYLIRTPSYSGTGGNTASVRSRLIPQSENSFDCTCGLGFVFTVDELSGRVTQVSEVHVSGAWPFERVD